MVRRLDYRLLGPLEVVSEDRPLALGRTQQRAVLALLLLDLNRAVSTDRLVEELWPARAPGRPQTAIQGYVSGLRKALGPESIETTAGGGYRLRAETDELDSRRFEALLQRGQTLSAGGQPARAEPILRSALELWRGPALVDFAYQPWAEAEIGRLDELRLVCTEELVDAQLALARHAAVVGQLEAVVGRHPLRERPRRQLMLALYRSGRQADALDVYGDARVQLRDTLGIDPSPDLQNLYKQILNQDAALRVEEPTVTPRRRLPASPTRLVGRAPELKAVTELLADERVRLLTLTGPGGIGKTRLGLAACEGLADRFPDGVFFVDLSAVRDVEIVVPTIAQALGLAEVPGQEAEETLAAQLADKSALLLLDNFEQVTDAAPAVARLVEACAEVKALVTSRERLHLGSEREYPVPPLGNAEAAALFEERATAVEPSFARNADVEEICARLDCLPLAIELAAARVKLMSPRALLERLDRRIPLLVGGARDAPARHRTLRTTIEWSHDLLSPSEQQLFADLAVFAGGSTLQAAEDVCGAGLATIGSLIDKSLLRHRSDRYLMLETIREFALERLDASGRAPALRERHALHFEALAERAEAGIEGSDQAVWLDHLERDHDNLRAALRWAEESGAVDYGLRLAGCLWPFWAIHGHLAEGSAVIQRLLAGGSGDRGLRAKALHGAVTLARLRGDYTRLRPLAEEELELCRVAADPMGLGRAFADLGLVAEHDVDPARAIAMYGESAEQYRRAGFESGRAGAIASRAYVALEQRDWATALPLFEESLVLYRSLGHARGIAQCLSNLGTAALRLDRHQDASAFLCESLQWFQKLGYTEGIACSLIGLAAAARARDEATAAVELAAGAQTLCTSIGVSLGQLEQDDLDDTVRVGRTVLGEQGFQRAWDVGSSLTADDLVARAVEHAGSFA